METKEKMGARASAGGCDCDCSCCQTSMWNYGHGHRGIFVIRFLLGIAIIMMVFWIGLQVGEFKGYVEANFGGYHSARMMMFKGSAAQGMSGMQNGAWQDTQGQTPVMQTKPLPTKK